jgi:glyceraldehyde 3-phosphate dehydrogenase
MKIGINGFGRIGKIIFKALIENNKRLTDEDKIEIVQINDIAEPATLAHLLKYDSIYGRYESDVTSDANHIIVDGKPILVSIQKDIKQIPWLPGIELVIESTGAFTGREQAASHIRADNSVKRVLITAPSKDADAMIVLGVNEHIYDPNKHFVISNASCTTNSLAPAVKVLNDHFGLERGFMTTVHAYTTDQRILDLPHKDPRRARAGAINIIPTTTGAADAVGIVIPELKGKLTGISLRVPSPCVSITDFVCTVKKTTTIEEVNEKFTEASKTYLKDILDITMEPLVSSDFRSCPMSGTIDGLSTNVVDGTFIKILSWYDNEWGYSCRTAELVNFIHQKGK